MRIHLLALTGLVLFLFVVPPVHAQTRRPVVGALVVVSQGKEWQMAARVLEKVRAKAKVPRTKYVLVEAGVPLEPRRALRRFLKQIRRARKDMHKMRLKPAISRLEDVIREIKSLLRTRGATIGLLRRLRQATGYLGASQQLNADLASATVSFTVMLNIDPDRTLSPKYFPTEVIQAFGRIKRRMRHTATLRVNTDQPAFVFVDGHLKGTAPTVINDLTPGFHVVELRRLGRVRITRLMEIDSRLGATLKARIVNHPEQAALRTLLVQVERELRNRRKSGPAIAQLTKALRVDHLVACRAGLDDGEASYYDGLNNSYIKRVRRLSAVPGTPPGKTIAKAMTQATPVMDLQAGSGTGGGSCENNDDCPDGTCVSGRCQSDTPFYKKWWFWTLIGVGVAAVAGGTAAIVTMPQRPAIRITLGGN